MYTLGVHAARRPSRARGDHLAIAQVGRRRGACRGRTHGRAISARDSIVGRGCGQGLRGPAGEARAGGATVSTFDTEEVRRRIEHRDRKILQAHGPGAVTMRQCLLCGYLEWVCSARDKPSEVCIEEMMMLGDCPRCTVVMQRAPEIYEWMCGIVQHLHATRVKEATPTSTSAGVHWHCSAPDCSVSIIAESIGVEPHCAQHGRMTRLPTKETTP